MKTNDEKNALIQWNKGVDNPLPWNLFDEIKENIFLIFLEDLDWFYDILNFNYIGFIDNLRVTLNKNNVEKSIVKNLFSKMINYLEKENSENWFYQYKEKVDATYILNRDFNLVEKNPTELIESKLKESNLKMNKLFEKYYSEFNYEIPVQKIFKHCDEIWDGKCPEENKIKEILFFATHSLDGDNIVSNLEKNKSNNDNFFDKILHHEYENSKIWYRPTKIWNFQIYFTIGWFPIDYLLLRKGIEVMKKTINIIRHLFLSFLKNNEINLFIGNTDLLFVILEELFINYSNDPKESKVIPLMTHLCITIEKMLAIIIGEEIKGFSRIIKNKKLEPYISKDIINIISYYLNDVPDIKNKKPIGLNLRNKLCHGDFDNLQKDLKDILYIFILLINELSWAKYKKE